MSIKPNSRSSHGVRHSGEIRPSRPQALIKHYAQIMSAMMQLDVSSPDVSTVRALLRPYLPGVEVHLGYLPDRQDDMERERAYWLARLLRVLRTPLQQPVANVRVRSGLDHPRG